MKTYGGSKDNSVRFMIGSCHPADVSTGGGCEAVIVIVRDEGGLGGGEGEVALGRLEDLGRGCSRRLAWVVGSSSAAGHGWPVFSLDFTDLKRQMAPEAGSGGGSATIRGFIVGLFRGRDEERGKGLYGEGKVSRKETEGRREF